jgi:hypothetical protein
VLAGWRGGRRVQGWFEALTGAVWNAGLDPRGIGCEGA